MPNYEQDKTKTQTYLDGRTVNPQIISAYMFRAIAQHFSEVENIQDPALRKSSYLWRSDNKVGQKIESAVRIEMAGDYKPASADQCPSIVIARMQTIIGARTSLGSKMHTPANLIGTVDANHIATLGHNQVVNDINGSLAFYCISEAAAASEILGIELMNFCLDYEAPIRQDLGLKALRVASLERTTKLENNEDKWVTTLVLTYNYQKVSIVRSEAPILKVVTAELSS